MSKIRSLLLAAALLGSAGAAQATTIVNGGFEIGAPASGYVTAPPPGWYLQFGTVDHIGTYWQNGNNSLGSVDLSGNGNGSLAQDISTVIGKLYTVTFQLAGNPDGGNVVKSLSVAANNGQAQFYAFDTTGATRTNMGWVNRTYQFTANSTTTTLSFASGDTNAYGPAIDNVAIAGGVPEPATWAMLILGFGVIGGAMRRRRAPAGVALV